MIDSIRLSNFLSFGYSTEGIQLNPLNIIIGTNGSGKSNFLEAFDLLRCAPSDITKPIREGGGVYDWLYKGDTGQNNAVLDVTVKNNVQGSEYDKIRYWIEFNAVGQQFGIVDEKIVSKEPATGDNDSYIFYSLNNGRPALNFFYREFPPLQSENIDTTQSILVQKRDAIHYPEITQLAQNFSKIKMYRDWNIGRNAPARMPQKADLKNDYLEPDCSNLGLVLKQIGINNYCIKKQLLKELQFFYPDVEDYDVSIASNTVQLFFQERGLKNPIPATRLSDGTLRYLCLLAILCHPTPPPVVCIEEPELGLHPDVLPNLAKLLVSASERSQFIVTTHSEMLVDAFTNNSEAFVVAEKSDNGTQLTRLNSQQIKPWLEKYRLGQLWTRGDIGGIRW